MHRIHRLLGDTPLPGALVLLLTTPTPAPRAGRRGDQPITENFATAPAAFDLTPRAALLAAPPPTVEQFTIDDGDIATCSSTVAAVDIEDLDYRRPLYRGAEDGHRRSAVFDRPEHEPPRDGADTCSSASRPWRRDWPAEILGARRQPRGIEQRLQRTGDSGHNRHATALSRRPAGRPPEPSAASASSAGNRPSTRPSTPPTTGRRQANHQAQGDRFDDEVSDSSLGSSYERQRRLVRPQPPAAAIRRSADRRDDLVNSPAPAFLLTSSSTFPPAPFEGGCPRRCAGPTYDHLLLDAGKVMFLFLAVTRATASATPNGIRRFSWSMLSPVLRHGTADPEAAAGVASMSPISTTPATRIASAAAGPAAATPPAWVANGDAVNFLRKDAGPDEAAAPTATPIALLA